ncbi:MAG: tetratricopeptide repeat protein, partial [Chloroflexales bacterium]|nr:tetratricopeptide repeat protein [Chloroflexales bacterium]
GAEYGQHAIVQAYYYKRLGTQRKALHQSAAVFYEREERDRMKAAHHYEQAGQVAKAVKLATSDVEGAINSGQARALARLLARIPAGRLAQDKAAALHTVRGELAALLGDYTLAREELTEALEAVPRDDDVRSAEAQARRYRLLAMVDERTGEYDRAEAACRSGLACVARPDVPYREPARLQIQLAQLLWRRHDLDGVEHACRYGLELLPREPAAPTERAELQQRVALVKGARGDYRGAIEGLENSLHRARRSGDRMLIAMILHNLGLYCQRMGQSEQALAYYTESLDLKEQVGDVAGRVRTLINRGGVYQEGGHYTVALDCFAEARMLCERHNLVEPLAEVAANLGLVCFMLKNLPGAEAHFAEALAIDSRLGNAAGMADTEYRLGDLHLAQGDPAAAEQHAERALALAKQIGSSIYSACALRVRGEALVAQGRLAEAAEALQQAEQYQRTVDDPYDLTLITLAQARLAAAAGDREAARALTTDGLAVAREYRLPYQIGLLEALEAQLAAPGEERWDEHNLP